MRTDRSGDLYRELRRKPRGRHDAAIVRLVTAVIVKQHDEWAVAERRYLSEETSMARLRQVPTPRLPGVDSGDKQLAG